MNTSQLTTAARKLRTALRDVNVTNLGIITGFAHRLRDVTPHLLSVSVLSALASQRVESIADLLRAFNALTGKAVQYKPFHNQLAKSAFPRFMRGLFERLIEKLLVTVLEPVEDSSLRVFTDIVLQDGSSFAIHPSLTKEYPGRFTKVSPAAVEIHTTMSLLCDNPQRVEIAPDSQGERDFLPAPKELKGKLLLADRGYCGIEYGDDVRKAEGSFIIRSKRGMNPTVLECSIGGVKQRRFVGKKLRDIQGKLTNKTADLEVEWIRKKQPIRMRLLLLWNATRNEHVFLMTNLERERFDVEAIGALYRLRWQIELMFKEYKSYANLHAYSTSKAAIAEGLMWASLAAALLKRFLAHSVQMVFATAETSTRKVAMALAYHLPRLMRALIAGRAFMSAFRELLEYLEINARRAHPARDRARGRLSPGLMPVHTVCQASLKN